MQCRDQSRHVLNCIHMVKVYAAAVASNKPQVPCNISNGEDMRLQNAI
jgi:hypothetical protein